MSPQADPFPPVPRRTTRAGKVVERKNILAELLGSVARAEVLRVLFGLSIAEVYIAEIVRRTGMGGQGVDEQLRVLLALELVTTRPDGNRRYYQANTAHPLYPELRGLLLKSSGMRDALAEALQSPKVEIAFVFGSLARREERAESDVDLMIFGDAGAREFASNMRRLCERLNREINPCFFTMAEVRRRLAANDHFLARVLEQPKLFVVGDEGRLARWLEQARASIAL